MRKNPDRDLWRKIEPRSNYDAEWKESVLRYIKEGLRRHGVHFDVIVDCGSGSNPVSRALEEKGSKVLYFDFVEPQRRAAQSVHIDRDLREVAARESSSPIVDIVVFSDVLNYLPYKAALRKAYAYLKPGGAIVIFGQPERTFRDTRYLLDPKRARTNDAIERFLIRELGMEPIYSDRIRNSVRAKEEYLIGAYKKRVEIEAGK